MAGKNPTKWQAQRIARAIGAHEIYVSHKVLVFTEKYTVVEVTYRQSHPSYIGGTWNEIHDTAELICGGRAEVIEDAPKGGTASPFLSWLLAKGNNGKEE